MTERPDTGERDPGAIPPADSASGPASAVGPADPAPAGRATEGSERASSEPARGSDEGTYAGTRREPPEFVKKLRRRRDAHRDRGRVYRIAWVTAGFIVVLAGLVMVVFPGPALLVIPIGLAMLSLEFAWAERLLDSTLERGVEAKDIAAGASRRQKIVGGAAIVCAIAAVATLAFIYVV